MPQKNKPKTKLAVEQKEYYTYNPQNIKQSVEIAVKPKPSLKDLETVEKVGKPKKIKALKKVLETDDKPVKLNPKGYSLIITEKPQAALKIANALGKTIQKDLNKVPYYEVNRNGKEIIVGCAVGHLFTLKQNSVLFKLIFGGTYFAVFVFKFFLLDLFFIFISGSIFSNLFFVGAEYSFSIETTF